MKKTYISFSCLQKALYIKHSVFFNSFLNLLKKESQAYHLNFLPNYLKSLYLNFLVAKTGYDIVEIFPCIALIKIFSASGIKPSIEIR